MAAALLYCVCRQPYDVSRFMIECDICKDWFHGRQLRLPVLLDGEVAMKKRNNWHRHDYTEAEDGSKPVQAGTSVFVRELQARSFPSADEIILKMQGSQVTQKYLEKQGFESPIMVPTLDGIGLKLPPPSFSVKDVEHYVVQCQSHDQGSLFQSRSKIQAVFQKLSNTAIYSPNPNTPSRPPCLSKKSTPQRLSVRLGLK
ncbi:Lysine-specific demethylase 7B [Acipenser ruthenus]|uniref:Lysine-specific demethylase 7B n=1 Tax=Acipenser ruthenus TaxID=7906 RepID=A0A444V7Q0_ACIRT|nr:Lysine-specific demethylase 7B [Acipenser ruthenus]